MITNEETKDKKKSVLIVDDSWVTRQFLMNLLKYNGYNVLEVNNGKEAIDLLKEQKPDIIILDVLMPVMDGYETLYALKSLKIEIPTVILSADIQESTAAKCMELGAYAFVSKPVRDSEILPILEKAIQSK